MKYIFIFKNFKIILLEILYKEKKVIMVGLEKMRILIVLD